MYEELIQDMQQAANAIETLTRKLKGYEDAEEQGRLVVLPCKVGDILYAPTRNMVSEFRITYFEYSGYTEPYLFVHWEIAKGITGKYRIDGISASEIGKTVFLSREEAEKALGDYAYYNKSVTSKPWNLQQGGRTKRGESR